MLLFSLYVDNEYTLKVLEKVAKKFDCEILYQYVKKNKKFIIAVDFVTKK